MKRTKILTHAVPLLSLLLCASAQAKRDKEVRPPPPAEQGRYLGPHPVVARLGGGYCYIEVPHLHAYVPDRPALYQRIGSDYLFTGDPVPFGYDGPRTTYYGAHPVRVQVELPFAPPPTYCAIRGPHFHDYAPPELPDYRVKDGVVFYVGPLAPEFVRVRPQVERTIEAEYRPYVSLRPQVVVTPPPEWHGEVWVAPPAPGVVVAAPAPPRVQVVAPQPPRVHIVAPQPPSVVITPPAPPSVHIVAPSPPGVIVAPAAPGVVVVPGHPGKHKGWHKIKIKHHHHD
jgi:hypothetical protein